MRDGIEESELVHRIKYSSMDLKPAVNSGSGSTEASSIIQILANLHEFVRESTLRKKLKEFYEFDESDKCQTIYLALKAAPSIEPDNLSSLVTTWMNVLSEFDTSKIVLMLRLYCQQLYDDSQILNRLNIDSLISAFLALNEAKKEKFITCLKEAILGLPNVERFIQIIPDAALNVLKMK